MLRAMYAAATGMEAQDKCLAVIANNLANVNTVAFKSQKAYFEDLFYETYKTEERDPPPIQIGHGTKLSSTPRNFVQGEVQETGAPLDLMIRGDGFFRVVMPDGSFAYTRDGSFKLNGEGYIVDSHGYPLDPELVIPEETTRVNFAEDGKVSVVLQGKEDVEPEEIGEIILTKFINPAGLEAIGRNLYKPTTNSGDAIEGLPGIEGFGLIEQGYLELSNVNVMDEMIQMILAQRAYELNSKVITTADQMFATANRIR